MLNWNAQKVKNLSGAEIWFFIIARVLVGFGLGVVGVRYFPKSVGPTGFPALALGLVLFIVASKGLLRTNSNWDTTKYSNLLTYEQATYSLMKCSRNGGLR